MAMFDITYRCGHSTRVNIVGPEKDRQRKADWMKRQKCKACSDADIAAERQAENAAAAAKAAEQGLPALTGSLKAVAYAETCRQEILDRITVARSNVVQSLAAGNWDDAARAKGESLLEELDTARSFIVVDKTSAGWWIDQNKKIVDTRTLHAFIQRMCLEASRAEEPQAPEQAVTAPTSPEIIRPESPRSEMVATIRVIKNVVEAHFEEKNDDFRQIVKNMGFTWSEGRWERALKWRHGSPVDRAAELGHRLLSAGFIITADPEIGRKAAAGEYEPEHTLWVAAITNADRDHPGWFYISWGPKDEVYHAARRITGSRYRRPGVVVPPRHFEEVIDFAASHGFRFTPAAESIMAQAKASRAKETVVSVPEIQDRDPVVINPIPPKLVAAEETVDESLRDDD